MVLVGPLETCPLCGAVVIKGRLSAHIALTHKMKNLPESATSPIPSSTKKSKKIKKTGRSGPSRGWDDYGKTGQWW
jgi:hypothetical protein